MTRVDIALCAECHCLAARQKARAITRIYDDRLRPHGLRATQFSVLVMLTLAGPLPLSELAERLGVERTTLTRSSALLERSGWVRTEASDDARERPLRLTGAGRRKVLAAYPAWKEAQDQVVRDGLT